MSNEIIYMKALSCEVIYKYDEHNDTVPSLIDFSST